MSKASEPTPREVLNRMAENGDVLGLFDHIQKHGTRLHPDVAMGALSRCIRTKATRDLSGLTEDAFAAILMLGTTMLLRCQLHIGRRLREADESGSPAVMVPNDLVEEGWFERAERTSRFVGEMASTRARVRHLNGLADDIGTHSSERRSSTAAPLEQDQTEAPPRKEPPGNGRLRVRDAESWPSEPLARSLS